MKEVTHGLIIVTCGSRRTATTDVPARLDHGGSSLVPAASWWIVTPAERNPVRNTVLTEAGSNPISLAFGGCASLFFNRSAKCNCSQRC